MVARIKLVGAEEAVAAFLDVEQVAAVVAVADIGCRDMPEALVRSCLSLAYQLKLDQQSQESMLQLSRGLERQIFSSQ